MREVVAAFWQMNNKKMFFIFLLFSMFCPTSLATDLIVSLRSPETSDDARENYNFELVRLALEKTRDEYGGYQIQGIPPMNTARSLYSLEMDLYPNLLIELSYQEKLERELNLRYIDFPIVLGIVGYRVCFVSPNARAAIQQVKNIDELKKFTIAQGFSWADTDILRYNGFSVLEVSNYISIFQMVAHSRVDLFCRGANELRNEYESFKHIDGLMYDDSFVLFYPLPRFYYLNKKNTLVQERIKKGLIAAYKDGSLQALWMANFLENVQFTKLKQRKLFELKNPFIESLQGNYKQYFYNPMQ